MIRRTDHFGIGLLLGLATVVVGAGAILVCWNVARPAELVGVAVFGGVLVAGHRPRSAQTPYHNTFAHGAARLSSETETHAASTGNNKAADLHEQKFSH